MTGLDACAVFRGGLMDHVEGALPPAAADAARAHEGACAACGPLARDIRAQVALFSRARRPAPPADLGARIEAALGARGRPEVRRRWGAWPGMAAAAAVAVAAIGLLGGPGSPAASRSVQVVDVVLPDRGSFLGRVSPNFDNPSASVLDPLVTGENP